MSQRDEMLFAIDFTRAMAAWVKEHKALSKALPESKWLFEMFCKKRDKFIKVNLNNLYYTYYAKFIEPDVEGYCMEFLRVIEPKVFSLISCDIEPYTIRYEFMTQDKMLIKHVRYSFMSMVYDRVDNDVVRLI